MDKRMESEDEERISRILRMQRQHREQLLHEMSPAAAAASAAAAAAAGPVQDNSRHHHHHQQQHTPSGNRRPKSAVGRLPSSRQACLAKDKWSDFSTSEDERGSSVFDPFPDLLAHSDEGPSRSQTQCQLGDASEMLGAELTRSVMDPHSPVTIERVSSDAVGNERSRQRRSRKDDIMTRSVPEFRSDGSPILHNYGKSSYGRTSPRAIPVRKVSSKRTEPPSFAASGGIPSTRSFEGCAGGTTPTAPASSSRLHQRSPSDGGLSRSASFRTPAGRSPYATVATASPRKTQRSSSVSAACPLASTSYSSAASPHKAPTRTSPKYCNGPAYMPTTQGNLNVVNNNNNNNNIDVLSLVESDPLLKQRSQAVGLEVLDRAAVRIQALWRGYRTRNHMSRVRNACQEVRLRRLEECVLDVQTKMAATEKALLRQQKEIEEERKCRNANKEALDRLLKHMEQLETHIAKVFQQHLLLQQQLAQHYGNVFKPIHNEPHSESSSSEATVGNSASTTSSATSHSPAKDAAPKDPEKDAGKLTGQGDASGCAEQPKPERKPESSHHSSHEQVSGDATSADDTSCASFSEAEVRSSKTEAESDPKRQTPANLEAACLTEVNDRVSYQ
ncbi:hypothetical protein HPB52_007509 [Rhipicephalus sanguineus]|uniref:Uncharacterized protein n=1 Tax=Rhipicephalus sanguineus TaxID=34632 RepID=A0A9D4PN09_RHISA|nr:hypothetical protein HPB52_007509 [Rhipicephalus sanguineus]